MAKETARSEATDVKQYVEWKNQWTFQERVLEAKDVKALGAETGKRVVWNQANGWRVPREELALDDDQLQGLLALEPEFRLVEG